MDCPYSVGQRVHYDGKCWLVVEVNPLGGSCMLVLQRNGADENVLCNRVTDCNHSKGRVSDLSAPPKKRRVSKGKAAPTQGKKKAVSPKKPVRRTVKGS
jgi:hypothetical protein